MTVATKPTVRIGTLARFEISPLTNGGSPYRGPIVARIETPDGTQLVSYSTTIEDNDESTFDMNVPLKQNGSFDLSVYAYNDISDFREPVRVTVVGKVLQHLGMLYHMYDTFDTRHYVLHTLR